MADLLWMRDKETFSVKRNLLISSLGQVLALVSVAAILERNFGCHATLFRVNVALHHAKPLRRGLCSLTSLDFYLPPLVCL